MEARYPADMPVQITVLEPCTFGQFDGKVVNISQHGLGLRFTPALDVGMMLMVEFDNQVIYGEIRYCRASVDGKHDAGLRIDHSARAKSFAS